jgi:hypothetical protein
MNTTTPEIKHIIKNPTPKLLENPNPVLNITAHMPNAHVLHLKQENSFIIITSPQLEELTELLTTSTWDHKSWLYTLTSNNTGHLRATPPRDLNLKTHTKNEVRIMETIAAIVFLIEYGTEKTLQKLFPLVIGTIKDYEEHIIPLLSGRGRDILIVWLERFTNNPEPIENTYEYTTTFPMVILDPNMTTHAMRIKIAENFNAEDIHLTECISLASSVFSVKLRYKVPNSISTWLTETFTTAEPTMKLIYTPWGIKHIKE